jgi:colanic acid biosynthesis glycosyl transferase WcaI
LTAPIESTNKKSGKGEQKTRVLTVESGFPPELTSSRIPYEFAATLAKRGHEVIVATVPPRRYAVSREGPGGSARRREIADGVLIIRFGFAPNGTSVPARIVENLLVPLFLLAAGATVQQPDVVHAGSPPLLVGLVAVFLGKLKQSPVVLRIQDVHPDALVRLGLIKNPWLVRGLEFIERFSYQNVDKVAVIGETYRRHVLGRGTSEADVTVIHNWSPSIPPDREGEDERKSLGWHGKFVITYAGTMSWPQDLETVVDAASLLQDVPDIRFAFVGDGVAKPSLRERSETKRLKNVEYLPLQSRDRYYRILRASDLCLISLKKEFDSPSIPSKAMDIMACGKPILANVPRNGDLAILVDEAQCGSTIEPGDPQAFAKAVLEFHSDPELLRRAGENGRRYAEAHLSLDSCIDEYEKLFSAIIPRAGRATPMASRGRNPDTRGER